MERQQVEKIFKRYDANGDGKISSSELEKILTALNNRSQGKGEELKRMMDEMDTNGDGFIDLKEFANFHCCFEEAAETGAEKSLRDAFKLYDKNKNGLISTNELHTVLKSLGDKCSYRDCAKMIASVDADGDGSVNFDEFKKMMIISDSHSHSSTQHNHKKKH